jgi:hypothetical protein
MTVLVSGGVASVWCWYCLSWSGKWRNGDGQTGDWRQRDAERESESVAANTAGAPAALLWRALNGSLAPSRSVCAKFEGGRSGQPTSSSSSSAPVLQLPKGHASLETPVDRTRQSTLAAPSATASLIAVALYRWKHVTSMLARLSTCGFFLLPPSPVSILPARSTGLLCLTLHNEG